MEGVVTGIVLVIDGVTVGGITIVVGIGYKLGVDEGVRPTVTPRAVGLGVVEQGAVTVAVVEIMETAVSVVVVV